MSDGKSFYTVKLCDMGEWKEVIIDNKFPQADERSSLLSFSSLKESQWWLLVLQKAWAKLRRSYTGIKNIESRDVLTLLTGAPVVRVKNVKPEFVNIILSALKLKRIVIAKTKESYKFKIDTIKDGKKVTVLAK